MMPTANNDFLAQMGQAAISNLFNNSFGQQQQQAPQQMQQQQQYPPRGGQRSGGFDRDGYRRSEYNRGPNLHEKVEKITELLEKQQQQQFMQQQQLMQAPGQFAQPTPMGHAPQATPFHPQSAFQQQPQQPFNTTAQHEIMPGWAKLLMDKCTETKDSVELMQDKIGACAEQANSALSIARDASNRISSQAGRISSAHAMITSLTDTVDTLKQSVELLSHKSRCPDFRVEHAEIEIKTLKQQVGLLHAQAKVPTRATTRPGVPSQLDDEDESVTQEQMFGDNDAPEEVEVEAPGTAETATDGVVRPQRANRRPTGTRRKRPSDGGAPSGARRQRRSSEGGE